MKPENSIHFSFNCAIQGFLWAVRTQRHMRYHCIIAVGVILAGLIFKVSALEFILLVFGVVLVLFAELINTACEALVDLISPDFHPLARRVKDVAAGAVLLVSVGVAIMGYLILAGYVFRPVGDANVFVLAGAPPGELAILSLLTVILLVVLLKAWAGRGTPLEGHAQRPRRFCFFRGDFGDTGFGRIGGCIAGSGAGCHDRSQPCLYGHSQPA